MDTKITNCQGYNSNSDIKWVENEIGVKFPKSFISINTKCDEGIPERDNINFFDNVLEGAHGTCIGRFLSLNRKKNTKFNHLVFLERNPPEFFPEGIIAFANEPAGNYFCFDYRKGKDNLNPPVVFWNHEGADTPEAISFLAENFESFLKMLKTEEEAEKEYESLKKKYKIGKN